MKIKKNKIDSNSGHYVAITYRRDNQWVIHDDLKESSVMRKDNFNVNINAIFYGQVNKI